MISWYLVYDYATAWDGAGWPPGPLRAARPRRPRGRAPPCRSRRPGLLCRLSPAVGGASPLWRRWSIVCFRPLCGGRWRPRKPITWLPPPAGQRAGTDYPPSRLQGRSSANSWVQPTERPWSPPPTWRRTAARAWRPAGAIVKVELFSREFRATSDSRKSTPPLQPVLARPGVRVPPEYMPNYL